MDSDITAMAEAVIYNIIQEDLDSLALIISSSSDRDTWRTVLRHELDITRLVDVGSLLQYDIVVPKLVLWGTETISAHHVAAMRGAEDALARFIREIGVPADLRLHSGATPLHLACFAGQLDTVRALIDEFHADIHRRDCYGWTALHYASVEGHFDVVELLLAKGADAKARDNDGTTAAFRAKCACHDDIVCLMESVSNSDELLLVFSDDEQQRTLTRASEPVYAVIGRQQQAVTSGQGKGIHDLFVKSDEQSFQDATNGDEQEDPYLLPLKPSSSSPSPSSTPTKPAFDENGLGDIGYATLTKVVSEELRRFKEEASKRQNQENASTTNDQFSSNSEGLYDEICKFGTLAMADETEVNNNEPSPSPKKTPKTPLYAVPTSSSDSCPPPLPPARPQPASVPIEIILPSGRGTIQRLTRRNQIDIVNLLMRNEKNEAVMDDCCAALVDGGLRSPGDWKRLARQLPISARANRVERRISAIDSRFGCDEKRKAMTALTEWRVYSGQKATTGELAAALRRCGLLAEVQLVEKASTQESRI